MVLWLAHTEELCEQAFVCFKQVWQASCDVCPLALFRFWDHYTQDLVDHRDNLATMHRRPTVLISTPHRMVNLLDGRTPNAHVVLQDVLSGTALIVVDEAHRAAAPSYRRILDAFQKAGSNAWVIDLSTRLDRDQAKPSTQYALLKSRGRGLSGQCRPMSSRLDRIGAGPIPDKHSTCIQDIADVQCSTSVSNSLEVDHTNCEI